MLDQWDKLVVMETCLAVQRALLVYEEGFSERLTLPEAVTIVR